jgi:uroporphyrinogen-III synthase
MAAMRSLAELRLSFCRGGRYCSEESDAGLLGIYFMHNFDGKQVLALESRRSREMAALITTYGGHPVLAPAMREVALESHSDAMRFISTLLQGGFDMVIFLTGVGTRLLAATAETTISREQLVSALGRVRVVARGPKPTAALKELGVAVHVAVPEPNTWRELLAALDREWPPPALRGVRVAVQEYGAPGAELLAGLQERGAVVTRVPVYRWALPENLEPLRAAIHSIAASEISVAIFTTSIQIAHLFQVAKEMQLEEPLRRGLKQCVIASIGPTTSEELQRHGLQVDLEASHPKMGMLVKEAAERCQGLLERRT